MTITPGALTKKELSITHTYNCSGHMALIVAVADASADVGVHRVTVITAERDDYIEIGQLLLEQQLM
jgi:hypothetical protein